MRIIKRFPLYCTCALLLVALLAGGAARGVEADMTKAAGSATEPRTAESSGTAETEENIPWTLDGEFAPGAPRIDITIEDGGIELLL